MSLQTGMSPTHPAEPILPPRAPLHSPPTHTTTTRALFTCRAGLTSLQMGMWASLFLWISAGSISMCTTRARLAKFSSLPAGRARVWGGVGVRVQG